MSISIGGNVLGADDFSPTGTTIHPPELVTRDITLWLDAANDYSFKNTSNYYDCGYGCQYYSSNPGCTNCNTIWRDMSGYGYDAGIESGAQITYEQGNGSAYFQSPLSSRCRSQIKPRGPRSYFIWIKYKTLDGTGGYALTGTQDGTSYTYLGIQSGGQGYFYAGAGANCGPYNYTFQTGVWYHNGFVLDSNGDVRLYVNGDLVDTKPGVGVGGVPSNDFYIGCVNNQHFMDAWIPMVHIYNRALTESEITQNFNNGRVRFKI
jgi:hypothetical protein